MSAQPISTELKPLVKRKLMIVAVEASADGLGAGLIAELRAQAPQVDFTFVGIGGPRMREAGVVSPFDIAELSIFGLMEGLKAYGRVIKRVREAVAFAQAEKPDAVILIDSWGYTLRVANGIRKVMPDVPLIKYVGPQVWAMRPGRAKTLAKSVDFLLALHPMDLPFYEREGLPTVMVGNPALSIDFGASDPAGLRVSLGITADDPLLMVLPGSRPAEIKRLMPVFSEVMLRLCRERPDLTLVMPVAATVREAVLTSVAAIKAEAPDIRLHLIEDEARKLSAMQAADLALACSGTVSTELALAGCPMVIAYKVEPFTNWMFLHFATIRYITMLNILADKEIAPEFRQEGCTADGILKALDERLDNKILRNNQIEEQFKALDVMGRGQRPTAERAAAAVLAFLKI